MSGNMPSSAPQSWQPSQPQAQVLDDAEVARRMLLLAELQAALSGLGVHCTLARNHRLVLRYGDSAAGRNGVTDPQLFVFAESGTTAVATDGSVYKLRDGQQIPAADPAAAAAVIICRAAEMRTGHCQPGHHGSASADLDPGAQLPALAHPELMAGQPGPGRNRLTRAAVGKDAAQPGLHAAVTPDPAAVHAVMACRDGHQPGPSEPGTSHAVLQDPRPA